MALRVKYKDSYTPDIREIKDVLLEGVKKNFLVASVDVVTCPDLTQAPYHLAAPGFGGSPRILDIGGVPYLMPIADKSKFYDLAEVAHVVGLPDAFLIGPGAGSSRVAGKNCEMMVNVKLERDSGGEDNIKSWIAKLPSDDDRSKYQVEPYQSVEGGPLINLLASEGKPGTVLEIKAKSRTGPENFITCLRKQLANHYGDKPVAMGGVFLIAQGKAKLHIMPDFSDKPLNTEKEINDWLTFHDMKAPLICLTEFVSHDPDLDLRIEHTHCFSNHGDGGHYHYDITPEEVEYHAFFTLAEKIYRVDWPVETHQLGRD